MAYKRGWPEGSDLLSALQQTRDTDRKLKYTTVGVHRADVVVRTQAVKAAKRLSRGQLKMLACACYFAQAELASEGGGNPFILLFDDLPAELDEQNRKHLLVAIKTLFPQAFITALHGDDILRLTAVDKVFHVEQGIFGTYPDSDSVYN